MRNDDSSQFGGRDSLTPDSVDLSKVFPRQLYAQILARRNACATHEAKSDLNELLALLQTRSGFDHLGTIAGDESDAARIAKLLETVEKTRDEMLPSEFASQLDKVTQQRLPSSIASPPCGVKQQNLNKHCSDVQPMLSAAKGNDNSAVRVPNKSEKKARAHYLSISILATLGVSGLAAASVLIYNSTVARSKAEERAQLYHMNELRRLHTLRDGWDGRPNDGLLQVE